IRYSWAYHSQPGGYDLRLEVAMVPGEARVSALDQRVIAEGESTRKEEVGVPEHGERGRSRRIGGGHVQVLLLPPVGEGRCKVDLLHVSRRVADIGVERGQCAHVALECAHGRIGGTGLAVDVEVRRVVGVNAERGYGIGGGVIRTQQRVHSRVYLTGLVGWAA